MCLGPLASAPFDLQKLNATKGIEASFKQKGNPQAPTIAHSTSKEESMLTQMKQLPFLIILLLGYACQPQQKSPISVDIPRGINPQTPTQVALEEVVGIPFKALKETQSMNDRGRIYRSYDYENKPYNGWARQLLPDTDHRYRYMKFIDGVISWQIGYYADGTLDFDFHGKNGENYGSQRMWLADGTLYIDTYFLEGGVQHGPQKRWHSNHVLARDALYEKGELVYEVLFDQEGRITEKKGKVPSKYE